VAISHCHGRQKENLVVGDYFRLNELPPGHHNHFDNRQSHWSRVAARDHRRDVTVLVLLGHPFRRTPDLISHDPAPLGTSFVIFGLSLNYEEGNRFVPRLGKVVHYEQASDEI
jgi:hypothetical protein